VSAERIFDRIDGQMLLDSVKYLTHNQRDASILLTGECVTPTGITEPSNRASAVGGLQVSMGGRSLGLVSAHDLRTTL
jgi:hypothetical protein